MFGLALENHWRTQYGCNQLETPLNHTKKQQTVESKASSKFPLPLSSRGAKRVEPQPISEYAG